MFHENYFQIFARRGLDKVNELARMENFSAEETTDISELTFRATTLKVCSILFVRSGRGLYGL